MIQHIKKIKSMKGEVSILAVAITACATIVASALGAWATAKSSANSQISTLETKVEAAQKTGDLVTERESNHYIELQKSLDRIEKKIDKIQ